MTKLLYSLLLGLLLASLTQAEVKITGETKVNPYKLVQLEAKSESKDAQYLWDVTPEAADIHEHSGQLIFTGPPGVYKITVTVIDFAGKKAERARATVTIGEPSPPIPPGPIPPGPVPPGPVPPGPVPPSPIPAEGFRVLMVYESAELPKLTEAQRSVIYSKKVRDYLNSKCVKDAENPEGAYRIWDKDVDPSADSKIWQEALKRSRSSTPWVLISNGKSGYEGPLPANVDDTLKLLQKYGG